MLNKKSSCKRIHIVWYNQYLTDDYKYWKKYKNKSGQFKEWL